MRAEEKLRADLVPVTAWVRPGTPEPRIAEEVWSIGLRGKDEDFRPYFLMSRIGADRVASAEDRDRGVGDRQPRACRCSTATARSSA